MRISKKVNRFVFYVVIVVFWAYMIYNVLYIIYTRRNHDKIITEYLYQVTGNRSIATNILKWSKYYRVNWIDVLTIIRIESGFVIKARSKKGAVGLMQIGKTTFKWCRELLREKVGDTSNPYNIEFNIASGCLLYSSWLRYSKGDKETALILYNFGYRNYKTRKFCNHNYIKRFFLYSTSYKREFEEYYKARVRERWKYIYVK